MPPNLHSKAHGFAMRSMSLRDMQISKSEKKISWPCQILGTPLKIHHQNLSPNPFLSSSSGHFSSPQLPFQQYLLTLLSKTPPPLQHLYSISSLQQFIFLLYLSYLSPQLPLQHHLSNSIY